VEAHNRINATERAADDEVRAIEAATERAVAELTAGHLARAHAERQRVEQRERVAARRQARAGELEARHGQLRRIFDRARALLPEIVASTIYRDALSSHLDEALSFLEGPHPRVRCQTAFVQALRPAVDGRGAELVIDERVGAGFVAEAADGSVTVDGTLASRLARAEARLTIALAQRLGDASH
jgi:vacuolar-type H+-ATPase subunit E/Vma4